MQHQDPEAVRGSYINLEIYLICPLHFRYPHPIVSVDLQGDHLPSPLTFSHEYSKRGRKWWTDFWHELFWNLQQASLIDFDHLWILKFSNKNTKMVFFFFKNLHKHLPAGNYDDLFVLKKTSKSLLKALARKHVWQKEQSGKLPWIQRQCFFVFPRFHQFWQMLDGKQTVKENSDTSLPLKEQRSREKISVKRPEYFTFCLWWNNNNLHVLKGEQVKHY